MKYFAMAMLVAAPSWGFGQTLGPPAPQPPVLAYPASCWADVDGDGDQDLFTVGLDAQGHASGGMYVLTPQGLAPMAQAQLRLAVHGDAAWGDMDGDGDPDLALLGDTAGRGGSVVVYRNTGGVLAPFGIGLPGLSTGHLAWADFDGDGDQDLVCAGWSLPGGREGWMLRNDGSSFAALLFEGLGDVAGAGLRVGDVDGDGLVDLAACGGQGVRGALGVWRNQGGLGFVAVGHGEGGAPGGGMWLADVDGQPGAEVLAAGAGPCALVGLRWSGGQLAGLGGLPEGVCSGMPVAVDMDLDGDRDLVVAGGGKGGGELRVHRRQGGAWVAAAGPALPGLHQARLEVLDWNLDLHPDLHLTGIDGAGQWRSVVLTYDLNLNTYRP